MTIHDHLKPFAVIPSQDHIHLEPLRKGHLGITLLVLYSQIITYYKYTLNRI